MRDSRIGKIINTDFAFHFHGWTLQIMFSCMKTLLFMFSCMKMHFVHVFKLFMHEMKLVSTNNWQWEIFEYRSWNKLSMASINIRNDCEVVNSQTSQYNLSILYDRIQHSSFRCVSWVIKWDGTDSIDRLIYCRIKKKSSLCNVSAIIQLIQ